MLILNFDIAKSKNYLYESHEGIHLKNKEVCKVSDFNYVLEYTFTLDDIQELKKVAENYEKQIADIYQLVASFYDKSTTFIADVTNNDLARCLEIRSTHWLCMCMDWTL